MGLLYKAGSIAQKPGVYEERDNYGGRVPFARRVTIRLAGEKFPETQAKHFRWIWLAPPLERVPY